MGVASTDPATGKPTFDNSPSTTSDMQVNADYAETVGNRRVGTTAEREAETEVYEGLLWGDTTDDIEYRYDGSGWMVWVSDSGWINVAFEQNWASFDTATYGPVSYRLRNGSLLSIRGIARASTGAGGKIFNIPLDYRPTHRRQMPCDRSGAYSFVNIEANGDVFCATAPNDGTTQAFGEIHFSIN